MCLVPSAVSVAGTGTALSALSIVAVAMRPAPRRRVADAAVVARLDCVRDVLTLRVSPAPAVRRLGFALLSCSGAMIQPPIYGSCRRSRQSTVQNSPASNAADSAFGAGRWASTSQNDVYHPVRVWCDGRNRRLSPREGMSISISISFLCRTCANRARTVREPCANRAGRLQPSINDALPAADSNADTLQTLTNTQPTRAANTRARTRGVRPWDFWTGC